MVAKFKLRVINELYVNLVEIQTNISNGVVEFEIKGVFSNVN